jgi:hypothetical protein
MRAYRRLAAPALFGAVLMLPFVTPEWVNRGFGEDFPIVLFVVMWLLPAAAMVLLTPLVTRPRAPRDVVSNRFALVARVALAVAIAWFWVGLVQDQMPCFLGVPNCD